MTGGGLNGSSGDETVAVIAAMDEEIAALRSRVARAERVSTPEYTAVRGTIRNARVIVARTGDGAHSARLGAQSLLDEHPVGRLIVVGVSGALDPALRQGDLIVARGVRNGSAPVPDPDFTWARSAVERSGATEGILLSCDEILCTAEAKRSAHSTSDGAQFTAVDMETAAYAFVASERGIPYVAIRAISDTVHETLPLDFNRYRDASGGLRRARVLGGALIRPWVVPGLWRLRRRVSRCAEGLAETVCDLLSRGES